MPAFYKILKADPLGNPWTPNKPGAKPIQTWWCQVEGQDLAVSIGKQVGNTLRPGQHVYGDLVYAKSQKGNEYWKLNSQQVPEGVERPQDDPSTPAQAQAQAATGGAGYAEGWAEKNKDEIIPKWFAPFGNMISYIYDYMKEMKDAEGNIVDLKDVPTDTPPPAEPAKVEQVSGEPIDEETQKTLDDIFPPPETPDDIPEEPAKTKKTEKK